MPSTVNPQKAPLEGIPQANLQAQRNTPVEDFQAGFLIVPVATSAGALTAQEDSRYHMLFQLPQHQPSDQMLRSP